MTERERWIIYPLLFFALGAALRDKFREHVSTKELDCTQVMAKRVICEELSVLDPAKTNRIVAKLTSGTPTGPQTNQNADSFGVLVLFDSEGKEFCGVTNNALQVRQVSCDEIQSKSLSIVDPADAQRRLALLASGTATQADGSTRRVGSLLLTDHQGAAIFGLANDQMQMRTIVCQGIAVVDPNELSRVLAVLGSAEVKPASRAKPQRLGVLQLNDQRFIGLTGNPTEVPVDSPPPPRGDAETDEDADADHDSDAAANAEEPAAHEEAPANPANPAGAESDSDSDDKTPPAAEADGDGQTT